MSDAAEAIPATEAPASGEAVETNAPAASPEEDLFELDDGQKLSRDDLKKHWQAIRTNYSKGKASAQLLSKADQRIKAAQEAEAKAAKLQERIKQSPAEALRELGLDPADFATQLLWPEIEKQQMTAEQRAFHEQKSALEKERAEINAWKKQQADAKEQAEVQKYQEQFRQQMQSAAQKVGLPESSLPWIQKRMAAMWEQALDAGYEDVSPDELAALVKDDFLSEHKALTANLSGQQLVEWLGDDVVKRIRQYDLQRLKGKQPGAQAVVAPPQPGVTTPTKQSRAQFLTPDEAKRQLDERIRALSQGGME